jgi:hypothetical protein
MRYWPDRASSATQFAFWRDPEPCCLEKEREHQFNPPALLVCSSYELSSPEATPIL